MLELLPFHKKLTSWWKNLAFAGSNRMAVAKVWNTMLSNCSSSFMLIFLLSIGSSSMAISELSDNFPSKDTKTLVTYTNPPTLRKTVRVRWLSLKHPRTDFSIWILSSKLWAGAECIVVRMKSMSSSPPLDKTSSRIMLSTQSRQCLNLTISWMHLAPPLSRNTLLLLLLAFRRIVRASKTIWPSSSFKSTRI